MRFCSTRRRMGRVFLKNATPCMLACAKHMKYDSIISALLLLLSPVIRLCVYTYSRLNNAPAVVVVTHRCVWVCVRRHSVAAFAHRMLVFAHFHFNKNVSLPNTCNVSSSCWRARARFAFKSWSIQSSVAVGGLPLSLSLGVRGDGVKKTNSPTPSDLNAKRVNVSVKERWDVSKRMRSFVWSKQNGKGKNC